ncbi:hypothetical protein BOTBODRAFT_469928 [Botryobasidium botryosum FD-172 SS1]|uniref:Uncharacterized protein n=1 Tax=Botryobasidium botryosum (strain FD-172 SS1) TaxID=930990 RepID=A0A067M622_BOTB1|nr:hypothetical protein BOTBODRAFT_469928 [Botryobasidium botryosum FD-172 SS1]
MEALLVSVGITFREFDLDHCSSSMWREVMISELYIVVDRLCALIVVGATAHQALDLYSFFALTVSMDTGQRIRSFMLADLQNRQRHANQASARYVGLFLSTLNPVYCFAAVESVRLTHSLCSPTMFSDLESSSYCFNRTDYYCINVRCSVAAGTISCMGQLRATHDIAGITAPGFPVKPQEAQREDSECTGVWFVLINAGHKFSAIERRYKQRGALGPRISLTWRASSSGHGLPVNNHAVGVGVYPGAVPFFSALLCLCVLGFA